MAGFYGTLVLWRNSECLPTRAASLGALPPMVRLCGAAEGAALPRSQPRAFRQLKIGYGGKGPPGGGGIPSPSSRASTGTPLARPTVPRSPTETLGQQVQWLPGVSAPTWGWGRGSPILPFGQPLCSLQLCITCSCGRELQKVRVSLCP